MSGSATPDALEAVYRLRFRAFMSTVTAFLGDADAARDVVQESFASALARRDTYTGSGTLEAWVWRIVINRALDQRRLDARTSLVPDDADTAPSPNGRYEAAQAVRAQLAALPERQRLAVFLRYYADLDYESIARILEISPGTVGAALHQAHGTLRIRLREEVSD